MWCAEVIVEFIMYGKCAFRFLNSIFGSFCAVILKEELWLSFSLVVLVFQPSSFPGHSGIQRLQEPNYFIIFVWVLSHPVLEVGHELADQVPPALFVIVTYFLELLMQITIIVMINLSICSQMVHLFQPFMIIRSSEGGKVCIGVSKMKVIVFRGKEGPFCWEILQS